MFWLLACTEYALDEKRNEPTVPEPDIEVSPSELLWETIGVGCDASHDVLVSNVGEGPLTLSGTYAQGDDAWSAEFRTDTIQPGETITFTVNFDPYVAGEVDGEVIVDSDDPDEPEVIVDSYGHAASEELTTDEFRQEAAPIDVLWVIDNSSSMGQEQTRVQAGITSFFTYFSTFGLDYHMGVITTDIVNPIYSGRLVGSPTYIDTSTAAPETELAEAIAVGTEDMGDESGLAALELALTDPVLSAENAGFIRDPAQLVVIFLSDEPEQSTQDATHYIDFLSTVKADPADLMVSAIVGDYGTGCATTCDGAASDAQPGDKYLDVVDAYDGVAGSICTCDLAPTLDEIGLEATRYIRTFTLTKVPTDTTAIAVYVDGELVEEGWTYDPETNEILFDEPPGAGADIVVDYPAAPECE
jgi:hypothetical protein